jgi:heme-degrading monooxygenase HmoA
VIERHVTFHVKEGHEQAFAVFFRDHYRPAMAKMPGFVRASLLRSQDEPAEQLMVLGFAHAEAAAKWRQSDLHEELKPRLKSMYEKSELCVFHVIEE